LFLSFFNIHIFITHDVFGTRTCGDDVVVGAWSVQLKSGEIYRGLLVSAEDTMNVSLSEVIRTARNGQISKLPNVYLRGSSIRFIALPDLLKNAPVFKKVQTMKRKMEESQAQRGGGEASQKKRKRTE
jgi:small nuclear ribonucleoprotein D3